jgi:uncharacterized protein (DUF1800 family)
MALYISWVTSPTYSQRLATSRLVHRFNFGPTPGQYLELLNRGVGSTKASVMEHGAVDPGLESQAALTLPILGDFPPPNTPAAIAFWNKLVGCQTDLTSWWLDRMYLSHYPLTERMTWFWHGHWATALSKVFYPVPMQKQNNTMRSYALGNFDDMARAMVVDGALNYWLDNEENYLTSPNENLARELMELMTLGVNKFTESDVTAAARALTGYSTNIYTGAVVFDPSQHYSKPITILGKTGEFNAETLVSVITAQSENAKFITDRLWFRFVSASTKPPTSLASSFSNRDISSLVSALVASPAWYEPVNSLAKSPVEWFVGACRALRVRPSQMNAANTQWSLSQMGQIPFNPPNVGGWPAGQAWLNSASLEYRFALAQSIVTVGDLSPLSVPKSKMVQACADWLGVPEWSRRSGSALAAATGTPSELAIAALLSPEYMVSA